MLGEDENLVRISVTAHSFYMIPGSNESPRLTLSPGHRFITIEPLVVAILPGYVVHDIFPRGSLTPCRSQQWPIGFPQILCP